MLFRFQVESDSGISQGNLWSQIWEGMATKQMRYNIMLISINRSHTVVKIYYNDVRSKRNKNNFLVCLISSTLVNVPEMLIYSAHVGARRADSLVDWNLDSNVKADLSYVTYWTLPNDAPQESLEGSFFTEAMKHTLLRKRTCFVLGGKSGSETEFVFANDLFNTSSLWTFRRQ